VRGRRRGPAPISPEALEHAARRYLERYATSSAHLKRILFNRVRRAERLHGPDDGPLDVEAALAAIESIVARLVAAGALDDRAYAESLARSQLRKGASRRAIQARLAAKGLGPAERASALAGLAETHDDPEIAAAVAYARRRRLGPFRPPGQREERRERDLAALSRRGFAPGLALRVIDAEDAEALEGELVGR
jgi:regulatory protein